MHTVAAGLFQAKDQIHFFKDIGYQHDYFAHCPQGSDWSNGKCSCNPKDNFGKQSPHSTVSHPVYLDLHAPPVWVRFVRLHSLFVSEQVADREHVKFMYCVLHDNPWREHVLPSNVLLGRVDVWGEGEREASSSLRNVKSGGNFTILSDTSGVRYSFSLIHTFVLPLCILHLQPWPAIDHPSKRSG